MDPFIQFIFPKNLLITVYASSIVSWSLYTYHQHWIRWKMIHNNHYIIFNVRVTLKLIQNRIFIVPTFYLSFNKHSLSGSLIDTWWIVVYRYKALQSAWWLPPFWGPLKQRRKRAKYMILTHIILLDPNNGSGTSRFYNEYITSAAQKRTICCTCLVIYKTMYLIDCILLIQIINWILFNTKKRKQVNVTILYLLYLDKQDELGCINVKTMLVKISYIDWMFINYNKKYQVAKHCWGGW